MNRPLITVPIGDPAGIGPEIVVKALALPQVTDTARVIVTGDSNILRQAARICGKDLRIHIVGDYRQGILNLIDLKNVDMDSFAYGQIQAMCGRAAYEYIEKSVRLAMEGQVDAVATTCINKEALRAAGVPYIGHTEIFGALTGTENPLTMFETNGMRIFFLTRHLSLRDMLDRITKENIITCVEECTRALERLGVTEGTMAIAGLNPHCGMPAVEELQKRGYRVAGPIGADSVFHQAAQGRYNSVLSLYHDQGHIAAKTLDFDRTISVTNGMPILRTSVDHGTAFDIAGTGTAGEISMVEAILLAARYAPHFRKDL